MRVDTHGIEDGRWLEAFRSAGTSRVEGDPETVETKYNALRFDSVDGEADDVGETLIGIGRSEQRDARHRSKSAEGPFELRA